MISLIIGNRLIILKSKAAATRLNLVLIKTTSAVLRPRLHLWSVSASRWGSSAADRIGARLRGIWTPPPAPLDCDSWQWHRPRRNTQNKDGSHTTTLEGEQCYVIQPELCVLVSSEVCFWTWTDTLWLCLNYMHPVPCFCRHSKNFLGYFSSPGVKKSLYISSVS